MTNHSHQEQNQDRPDSRLSFFGAITASISHELNNVISIIDQTNGLLEDLVAANESEITMTSDRLASIASGIQKQTERGLTIIKRLNRFAHSSDFPVTEYNPGEILENLCAICQRLADMKRVKLIFKSAPDSDRVTGNPFLLQQTVFEIIRAFLNIAQKDNEIAVEYLTAENQPTIIISGPSPETEWSDSDTAGVSMGIAELGAELDIAYNPDISRFRIILPQNPGNTQA